MNKYLKALIVFSVALLVGFGLFYLSNIAATKNFKEISYKTYKKMLGETNLSYIYIADKKENDKFNMVKDFADTNNLKFKYIYISNIDDSDKSKINSNSIVLVKNNKISEVYNVTNNFNLNEEFVKLGVIKRQLTKIDLDTYLNMVSSNENYIIFIGRETCHYCQEFYPIVDNVVKEYNVPIYYLDTDTFKDNNEWSKFTSSESFYTEKEWGTPLTIYLSKGKIVDYNNGYVEQEKLVSFLQKNGVIK